jgi:hypothetical protein
MLKIITSTNDSLHGRVLRKKYIKKGDVIKIKTPDGKRKRIKVENVKKTRTGYIIQNSNITLVLKEE